MSKKRGGLGKGRGARIRQQCSEFSRRVRGKQREKSVCKEDKAGGRVGQSSYHSSVLRTGGGTVSAAPRGKTPFPSKASRRNITIPACQPPFSCSRDISAALPQPQRCRRLRRQSRRTAQPTGGDPYSSVTCSQATPQRISNTFHCV